ncbi:MAG: formylglycine-generating enzyme family protein [Planctomycetaceae bacterium]|nr:formylglycine-generating enzyme family protein [Planctomycetaceae bacterium]
MPNETPGWQYAAQNHDLKIWLDQDTPLYFQRIPAGSFRMGSRGEYGYEEPIHRVEMTRPFYMSTFPVTQAQWRAVVSQYPGSDLKPVPSHFEGDLRPVEQVSWHDVNQWCHLVSGGDLIRFATDAAGNAIKLIQPRLDLPTEAQWEYACRAGTDTEYHTGDGEAAMAAAGWYDENSESQTHDVGWKARNAFGLYDVHGSVDEWCRDAWSEDLYKLRVDGVADPVVSAAAVGKSEDDADRVIRGGSWDSSAWYCRAAFRDWWGPGYRNWYLGFRVCLFFGPAVPSEQTGTGVTSEPVSGDVARRQAAAKSEDSGVDVTEVDLSNASLPERSDGTKF